MFHRTFSATVRRLSLIRIAAVLPLAACATMATPARVARVESAVGVESGAAVRNVFTTRLAHDDTARGSGEGGSVSKAWGTGRIVLGEDGHLEYLLTIYNPGAETFTSAMLDRSQNGTAGETVAIFFSDVSIRDRYIQLRGTMMVNRSLKAEVLVDELREHPGAFYVTVYSADGASGAIRGRVE